MARKKKDRPEWFKFWRRNRPRFDSDMLSLESRGRIFTNMLRYFDGDADLLEMTPLEQYAFNDLKVDIDDAFDDWQRTSEENRQKQLKRWYGESSAGVYSGIPEYTENREEEEKEEEKEAEERSRRKKQMQKEEGDTLPRIRESAFVPPTVEEVRQFCIENEVWIDPQRFVDDLNSKGWMKGRTKITDWKSQAKAWAALEATPERQKLRLTGVYDPYLRG